MISGYHDYRSNRRANLHFITDELVKRGEVFFLSLRYSLLSRFVDDPRHGLRQRANRVEVVNGVDCFLWTTPIHPCAMPFWLRLVERTIFAAFARFLPRPAREAIAVAELIFIESGIALIYLPLLRELNPHAQIVYLASDSLAAIGQAETIKLAFRRHGHLIDSARLPSPYLVSDIPAVVPCYFIPHGIEPEKFAAIGPSPYPSGTRNAVSVGSMLFDSAFFDIAGRAFPEMTFHVIGSGCESHDLPNVIYYREMSFEATLPFIKHADVAIAPYGTGVERYLTHTSMKLMQYGYLGVPAVCPEVVAGDNPNRFGYVRTDAGSIRSAVRAAIACSADVTACLTWSDVTERLLHPERFLAPVSRKIEHEDSAT